MSEPQSPAKTALERQMAELTSPDRTVRLNAVRRITHVFQRPDLATVDALLEISYQLWRLAEAYEIVNAVEPRRAGLAAMFEKARHDAHIEERARHPAVPPPTQVRMEDSYEYNNTDLYIRTHNALTHRGEEWHSKEQILDMIPRRIANFGKVSFGDIVRNFRRDRVSWTVIHGSEFWRSAPQSWRDYAIEHLDPKEKPKPAKVNGPTEEETGNGDAA